MTESGRLFGWAFGDVSRADEPGYLDELKAESLRNAQEDAEGKGVEVEADSAVFTVVTEGETLVELGEAGHNRLIVRCTVDLTGPGAERIRAEGPMNG